MSFTKKQIVVEIQLCKKSFQSGSTQVRIADLPIQVTVEKGGLPSFNTATITIRGLSLDRMQAISSLNIESMTGSFHKVNIYAGDDENGLTRIFSGNIQNAIADFSGAPDIAMRMECFSAYFDALTPQEPIAIQGESRVADLIGSIAKANGYTFKNVGVETKVRDTIIRGDARTKMRKLAEQAGAKLAIDDNEVLLAPRGKPFRPNTVTEINAQTGMVGYPVVDNTGMKANCHFNPSIYFGSIVNVKSVVPRASGKFQVIKVVHSLSANDPDGGDWFTRIEVLFNNGL